MSFSAQKTVQLLVWNVVVAASAYIAAAADGDLDISFGTGGKVLTALSSYAGTLGNLGAHALAIQPDGKIVVAGTSGNCGAGASACILVARYQASGSLDLSFGTNGIVKTAIGMVAYGHALALQPDGRIVVVGEGLNAGHLHIAVLRYLPNGSLDTGFGVSGIVLEKIGTQSQANAVMIQPDGRILTGGSNVYDASINLSVITLVRYNADGSRDLGFGSSGIVQTSAGGSCANSGSMAYSVAIQSNGSIIAGGYAVIGCPARITFALVRYLANGSPDPTFGENGKVRAPFSDATFRNGFAGAVAVAPQPDGSILAAGTISAGGSDRFALVRYTSQGLLDLNFHGDGIAEFSATPGEAYGLAIQSDGKVLVGGDSQTSATVGDFYIARFGRDGALDSTFGTNGVVTTPVGNREDYLNAIALQPDGRIVAAGAAAGPVQSIALVRYSTVQSADLTLTKVAAPVKVNLGADFTYTLTLTNLGPLAATGVTITDILPPGVSFVSASPGACSFDGITTVRCTWASVPVNAVMTVTLAVKARATGQISNTATVTSDQVDPTPLDATSTAVTTVEGIPDLAIVKSHSGNFTAGSQGTYSIQVSNQGSGATTGLIRVVDTVPEGLRPASASGSNWNCQMFALQTVTCDWSGQPLAAAAVAAPISLKVDVLASAVPSGSSSTVLTNTVTVQTAGDSNSANDRAADQTTVTAPPRVTINIAETLHVNDSLGVLPSTMLSISERVTVQDVPAILPSAMLSIAERVTTRDAVAVLPAALLSVAERVTMKDSLAVLPAAMLAVAERVRVQDTPAIAPSPPPTITGTVADVTRAGEQVSVTVKLTNAGVWEARRLNVAGLGFRVLSGSGTVIRISPALPVTLGDLAAGASTTFRIVLTCPATVLRLLIEENGAFDWDGGTVARFSISQSYFFPKVP